MIGRTSPVLTPLVFVVALGATQQPTATVTGAVDRRAITVGDRIVLTIAVEHDGQRQVAWPRPPEQLGPFEVLDHTVLDPVTVGGRVTSAARYVLTAFEIGDLEIPAIALGWEGAAPDGPGALTTAPVPVSVLSVAPEQAGDIRDIKPPIGIARSWVLFLPWLAGVAALGALAYWLYRRYGNRTKAEQAAPAAPARPPHEVALEALTRLEASPLLERGEIKQYFIEVSQIVRVYIEGRYGFVALEATSRDIVTELERIRLDWSQVELFEDFFRRSDLVKFAKDRPEIERCREVIPMARELIDGTRDRTVERLPESVSGGKIGEHRDTRAAGIEVG